MKPLHASLSLALLAACASYTQLPRPRGAQVAVARRNEKTFVELTRAHYYGDLYDDHEKWLLSPSPFADTHHLADLEGRRIQPKVQRGIAPAGTTFFLEQVEFPDWWTLIKRTRNTPRYNTWIYLRRPPDETRLPDDAPLFVLVLPLDLQTEEAVEAALLEELELAGIDRIGCEN